MSSKLVVSLSGLGHRALDQCAEFAAELDQRGVPLSLLIAPRPGDGDRPRPDSPVLRWVRDRLAMGDALALHGFDHAADVDTRLIPRLTQRPGGALRGAEFASLPAHEAGLRILAALAAIDQLGLRTDTFIPPRWFGSPGSLTALRRHGFEVCADALAVRELNSGRIHRARVHAVGPGEFAEPWWCRAVVLGAGRAARKGRMVRLAVDSDDLSRPGPRQAFIDAVDLALHHGLTPTTYAGFAGPARIPRPRSESAIGNRDPLSS